MLFSVRCLALCGVKLNWALARFDRRLAPLPESVTQQRSSCIPKIRLVAQHRACTSCGCVTKMHCLTNKRPAHEHCRVRNARWVKAEARGKVVQWYRSSSRSADCKLSDGICRLVRRQSVKAASKQKQSQKQARADSKCCSSLHRDDEHCYPPAFIN